MASSNDSSSSALGAGAGPGLAVEANGNAAKTMATVTTPLVKDQPAPVNYGGHDGDFVTVNEDRDLARGLEQRHVSLIAIAGAIGTGLFLGLGSAVQTGGPAGALLGYITVGLIVCAVQFALGEVTALLPVTGSFVRHAEFLVDPAMGFAVGWNIVSQIYRYFKQARPQGRVSLPERPFLSLCLFLFF